QVARVPTVRSTTAGEAKHHRELPPRVFLRQQSRLLGPYFHGYMAVVGACSHTRPVSLSRTAVPPKTHVNRLDALGQGPPGSFAGKALSQFGVTGLRSTEKLSDAASS